MKRNTAAIVLVACFAVIVTGVAASSLASTPVQSGFGVDLGSGSENLNNSTGVPSGTLSDGNGPQGSGVGIFATGETANSVSGSTSPVLILAGLVLLAIAGVLLVLWATTDRAPDNTSSDEGTPGEVASASDSSRTAPPVDPENVVQQAWWEMVQKTDVSETTTKSPGEIAAIAIESGLNPETVTRLTRLFQIVRYGEIPITDDTEQQARDLLDQVRTQSQGVNR